MLTEPIHLAVLCSQRAPGLDALLHHPARGVQYQIDCVVTTEETAEPSPLRGRGWREAPGEGVPIIPHPIHSFYLEWETWIGDLSVRRHYDAATAEILFPLRLDAILLLGYLYVITEPLLVLFPDRILNVHDSDLPRYPGLHATRDAILAGETETRSTMHIVTRELDAGPVIARSEAFPVAPFARKAVLAGEEDIVRAYAYAHREWMMRSCWGELVVDGLKTLAAAEALA